MSKEQPLASDKRDAEMQTISEAMHTLNAWDLQTCQDWIRRALWERWIQIQVDAFRDARIGARQVRGPRFPEGVSFTDLLPDLAMAKSILQDRAEPFDTWVRQHAWPGGMQLVGNTVRYWLKRYDTLIDDFVMYRGQMSAIEFIGGRVKVKEFTSERRE